jgi:hypothetical protein
LIYAALNNTHPSYSAALVGQHSDDLLHGRSFAMPITLHRRSISADEESGRQQEWASVIRISLINWRPNRLGAQTQMELPPALRGRGEFRMAPC